MPETCPHNWFSQLAVPGSGPPPPASVGGAGGGVGSSNLKGVRPSVGVRQRAVRLALVLSFNGLRNESKINRLVEEFPWLRLDAGRSCWSDTKFLFGRGGGRKKARKPISQQASFATKLDSQDKLALYRGFCQPTSKGVESFDLGMLPFYNFTRKFGNTVAISLAGVTVRLLLHFFLNSISAPCTGVMASVGVRVRVRVRAKVRVGVTCWKLGWGWG